jgi:hypothetical protein
MAAHETTDDTPTERVIDLALSYAEGMTPPPSREEYEQALVGMRVNVDT